LIGVISDTHGLLRKEVKSALQDVDVIIHAGDIGDAFILSELEKIAPLIAVRGNCDRGEWAHKLPLTNVYDTGTKLLYIIHDLAKLDIVPETAGISIVVYGHSHLPKSEKKGDVLYLNPGSAGPCRFNLPISMALIRIYGEDVNIQFTDMHSI
jgi:putative phosphoesterase